MRTTPGLGKERQAHYGYQERMCGVGRGGADRAQLWSQSLALGLLLEMQGGPTEHPNPSHPVDARSSRHRYVNLNFACTPLSTGIPTYLMGSCFHLPAAWSVSGHSQTQRGKARLSGGTGGRSSGLVWVWGREKGRCSGSLREWDWEGGAGSALNLRAVSRRRAGEVQVPAGCLHLQILGAVGDEEQGRPPGNEVEIPTLKGTEQERSPERRVWRGSRPHLHPPLAAACAPAAAAQLVPVSARVPVSIPGPDLGVLSTTGLSRCQAWADSI